MSKGHNEDLPEDRDSVIEDSELEVTEATRLVDAAETAADLAAEERSGAAKRHLERWDQDDERRHGERDRKLGQAHAERERITQQRDVLSQVASDLCSDIQAPFDADDPDPEDAR